ncbi:hypothetical protein POY95_19040 [Phocaeicola vulgatus]|nr:hypothetical protein [Phocaeicola vulgatus]MDC1624454.1 hypothetical protein [Phocaeicola vulgatus]MDC1633126.1 hypothetical protein [Phocaeicola vulgatus]
MKTDDIAHPAIDAEHQHFLPEEILLFRGDGERQGGETASLFPCTYIPACGHAVKFGGDPGIFQDSRIRHRDVEDNPLHHQFALAGDVQGVVSHDRTGHGRGIRVSLLRRDLSLFRRNTQADGGGGARILQDVDILVAGEKLVTPDMQGPIRITASIKRNGKIVIFRHAVTGQRKNHQVHLRLFRCAHIGRVTEPVTGVQVSFVDTILGEQAVTRGK